MVDFAGARRLIRRHGVDPVDGLLTCRWDVPNGLGRKARSAQHIYVNAGSAIPGVRLGFGKSPANVA